MSGPIGSQLVEDTRKPRRGGRGGKSSTDAAARPIASASSSHINPATTSVANAPSSSSSKPRSRALPFTLIAGDPLSSKNPFGFLTSEVGDLFNPDATVPVRGVANAANFCFMSAVLQALTHTPPFAHFCINAAAIDKAVAKAAQQLESEAPTKAAASTAAALGNWMESYLKGGGGGAAGVVTPPRLPFTLGLKGAPLGRLQEDASEFLAKLLECIDSDVAAAESTFGALTGRGEADGDDEDAQQQQQQQQQQQRGEYGERPAPAPKERKQEKHEKQKGGGGGGGKWITVGAKNEKLTVTKHTATPATCDGAPTSSLQSSRRLATSLFEGRLHHHIKGAAGSSKAVTSVNVEPFLVLPLDVAAANTIEEAFSALAVKESIDDDERNSVIKKAVVIGALPKVLIVQLRRWAVTREGEVVKLTNRVDFGLELVVPKEVCEQNKIDGVAPITARMRKYGLVAAVCHRGESINSGHYVTYLANQRLPQIATAAAATGAAGAADAASSPTVLLCNDAKITLSSLAKAAADCPYFLIYQRKGS